MSETNKICFRANDIAAFLDGELAPSAESAFERHLVECASCAEKLNEQKRLLCALDFAFDGERSFELPKDFAKTLVVRAESDVSGLRSRTERRRALVIAAGLFLLGVGVGVAGKKTGLLPLAVNKFLIAVRVVGEVLGGFCYDFSVSALIVLRAFGRQFVSDSLVFGFLLIVLLFVIFAAVSRLYFKFNRA